MSDCAVMSHKGFWSRTHQRAVGPDSTPLCCPARQTHVVITALHHNHRPTWLLAAVINKLLTTLTVRMDKLTNNAHSHFVYKHHALNSTESDDVQASSHWALNTFNLSWLTSFRWLTRLFRTSSLWRSSTTVTTPTIKCSQTHNSRLPSNHNDQTWLVNKHISH